ncbi:MAG: TonB-dependent receptor [Bacteroidota bacterium]
MSNSLPKKIQKFLFALGIIIFIQFSFCIKANSQIKDTNQNETIIKLVDLSLEELMKIPIVSSTRTEIPISDAPSTVHVISSEKIEARGYFNLKELLEDIPEIEIQTNSHEEEKDSYTIRGIYGNNKIIVLLNGIRYSPESGDFFVMGSNFSLENVERVEVLIGPASALYGPDAFSGVINIITKHGNSINGSEIKTSLGQFNTTFSSFIAGAKINDVTSFLASGHYYKTDEANYPKLFEKDFEWYNNNYRTKGELLLFNDTLVSKDPPRDFKMPVSSYSTNFQLNAGDFELGYARNSESHSSSTGVKPEYTIYLKDALWKTNSELIYVKHLYQFSNKKWFLTTTLKTHLHRLDPDSKFINVFNSFAGGYKYKRERVSKLEEQIDYKLSKTNTIVLGFSHSYFNVLAKTADLPFPFDETLSGDQQGLYYLGTNVTDSSGKDLRVFHDFHELSYTNTGIFAQLQCKLLKHVDLTIGTRYDYNTRYGESFNPRMGIVFDKLKKTKIKFNYGRAFRAPNPTFSYGHYGAFEPVTDSSGAVTGLKSSFWHLPNPDLKPEELESFEGIIFYNFSSNLVFSTNLYWINIRGLINESGTIINDSSFKGYPVDVIDLGANKGDAKMNGGTIKIESKNKMNGISFNPFLAYSYSNGQIDGMLNEEKLIASAKHTFKVGLETSYKSFSIYIHAIYRSSSYNELYNKNDPYTVINLFARYSDIFKSNKVKSSVFIKINNLFNTKYYNIKSEALSVALDRTPQAPFWFTAGFSIGFLGK